MYAARVSARGNAAGRSATRAPRTSASAGTNQSKDCPIARGTRALHFGRSVGSAAARVREHTNHRSRAAEQPDEVAAFQLIELHFFPPAGAELQDIDLAASSQRVSKRLCNLVAVYEPRFSEPVCNYGGPGRTANSLGYYSQSHHHECAIPSCTRAVRCISTGWKRRIPVSRGRR